MRTLATQVKLRRLVRTSADAWNRLASDPRELAFAGSTVDRLLGLAAEVRDAWDRETAGAGPDERNERLDEPLGRYVEQSLRSAEFALSGLQQAGADLELLRDDFEVAVLPLEIFLRGLDAEPALQRSA